MVLTYGIYILIFVLIVWGAKFAGFGNKFNDDCLEVSSFKQVRGIATLLIILHHISQRDAFQYSTKELFFFNNIGYLLVTIFFFSSGYGLTMSAKTKPNYINTFIKKRLPKILIPFFVTNIIFAIYRLISQAMPLPQILLGIFGIVNINENGWYPIVILIMYLVYYFATKLLKKDSSRIIAYILTTIILICIFCVNGHFAWWAGKPGWWLTQNGFAKASWWMGQGVLWFSGEWWVNSTIGFSVGAIFASYKDQIFNWFKKYYWLKLIVVVGLFIVSFKIFNNVNDKVGGYWTEFSSNKPQIQTKLMLSSLQLPVSLFFTTCIPVIMMKFATKNPITNLLSKISYETYLIGVITLDSFNFLIYRNYSPVVKNPYHYNLIIYTVCVILGSILLGYVVNRLDGFIIKKLENRNNTK